MSPKKKETCGRAFKPGNAFLVLAAALGVLCFGASAAPGQQDTDSHARDKSELVITSTNGFPQDWQWDFPRLKKAENLSGYAAVLKLRNCVKPGEAYAVTFSLHDPDGKEVALEKPNSSFVGESPHRNQYYFHAPAYEAQKSGTWKWTAEVENVGRFSTEIFVAPLTPQETQGLKRYEQAREAALLAFGHYWVGLVITNSPAGEGSKESPSDQKTNYFTAIVSEDYQAKVDAKEVEKELQALKEKAEMLKGEKEAAQVMGAAQASGDRRQLFSFKARHPEWNVTWKMTGGGGGKIPRDMWDIQQDLKSLPVEEAKIKDKLRPVTNVCYVELGGLTPLRAVSGPFLTEADRLNGITYQGAAAFGFRVYRFYHPESGWTEWYDAAYVPEHLAGVFSKTFGVLLDHGKFPNLSFSLLEKNGHWRATSQSGDLFVDGKKIEEEGSAPRLVGNFLPRKEMVREFLRTGKTPRDADRAVAEWVRKNPKELDDQIRETIDFARGKPL